MVVSRFKSNRELMDELYEDYKKAWETVNLYEFYKWCDDGDWVQKHYSELLLLYENKYVAVRNHIVLDSHKDKMKLIKNLQKKYGKGNTGDIEIQLIRRYLNK